MCFFFNDTATTEIYTYVHTLSLHDALPICWGGDGLRLGACTVSLQLTGNPSLPNPPLEGEGFGSAVLDGEGSYRLRASAWPVQDGAARPWGRATEMSSRSCPPSLPTSTFTASKPPLPYLRITSGRATCLTRKRVV